MPPRLCIKCSRKPAVAGTSRCHDCMYPGWNGIVGSAEQRGYGRQWKALRKRVLTDEPTCRSCGAPATDVDHIQPKARGGTDDRTNLQALCQACHRSKTASDSNRGGGVRTG